MNIKSYLEQIEKIDSLIEAKSEQLKSAKHINEAANLYCGDNPPINEKRIVDSIADLHRKRMSIISNIEKLPIDEFKIIYGRYVKKLDLINIADAMGKSYSFVTKKHATAIKLLHDILSIDS